MNYLNYIVWDPSPDIFSVGSWEMRWYGLLFALGFLIAQQIMFYIYRKEGKPERDVEALTFFMVIATILGARLGHVLFYEPDKYFSKPLSILKVWEGGLASHGAAFGILIAIYLYVNYLVKIDFGKFEVKKRKRPGQNYLWVVDRLVIVVALVGALIRLGNFVNSEIVGVESNSDYGVVFARNAQQVLQVYSQGTIEEVEAHKVEQDLAGIVHPVMFELSFARGINEEAARNIIENELQRAFRQSERLQEDIALPSQELNYTIQQNRGIVTAEILVDGIPRHPAQLYESLSSFLIFIGLFLLWKRRKEETPPGLIFGIFLIVLFGLRFLYEFIKENQVDFEDQLTLNMGQILSIPMVLAGIIILIRSLQGKHDHKKTDKPLTSSGS
jgi:phosphatidylglycerol:prolipoprotein diacylglycerol transferase